MKRTQSKYWLAAALASAAVATSIQAQTVTNPVSNRVISWNMDDYSTLNPTDLAGLAPAVNWVDSWLNDVTANMPDNTGATTTMGFARSSFNSYHVQGSHPGLDANGTANRELINGFLNSGPAAWSPWTTNTSVSLTNIPYAKYDVIVYLNSDTSGRKSTISDGTTEFAFSTMGTASRSGANALFLPTTDTNSSKFPSADFAFFPGLTTSSRQFTTYPKGGNDQWLGIAGFQVVECSNVYVLYGPSPTNQIVPVGKSASFTVMAGGLNPAYQWRHAGAPISGATNATYTIAATATGQDGDYDVVVTNAFSSMTSVVATLTFYTPKTVTWAGTGSTWDTSSQYWLSGSTATAYTETDNARFDNTGASQSTVSLASTVMPSSITVSNASYTFTSGDIGGTGGLRLMKNAVLILDTVDNRTGPTVIDSGCTLQLDNGDTAGAMGSGALTNNGGLVFNSSGDEAYGYPVYGAGSITNVGGSGTITLGNSLNGNWLVQSGGGGLLLQGSNAFSSGVIVSGGYLYARSAGSLAQAPVVVSGGELQLIFNINFSGGPMTLSGGLLHGGISGSASYGGQVSLATDSTIQVDSGNSFTLTNASGLNGGTYNLTKTGNGTLVLPGVTNTWASVHIAAGTIQVGNGGAKGGLGTGTVTDEGSLAFNLSGNIVVDNAITGPGNLIQNGPGTVTLTADNNANSFIGAIQVNAGTLKINGTSGPAPVTVNGGAIGGSGVINSSVTVLPGGAVAPGDGLGTLSIQGDLNLGGNLQVDVNKSLSVTSDLISVDGGINNTNTGIVTVSNLGSALAVGNSFTLFNKAVTGGEMLKVVGAGVVWTNKLATDGTIAVLSTSVPHPGISSVSVANGTNLVMSGTNGYAGNPFYVLSSTNVELPMSSWTVESSGVFGSTGAFAVTNPVSISVPQKFYRLMVP
jgi:autotransporter-associated beta strand protein